MANYTGYHCSPIKDATFSASVSRSLCVADSDDAAKSYLRGEAEHYVYEVEISGQIMGPKAFAAMLTQMGLSRFVEAGEEYVAAKRPAVRQAVVDAGFDAVRYGDTNGFDYECCEVFSAAAIVSVKCIEVLNECEAEEVED
jgi:hypothetical protein